MKPLAQIGFMPEALSIHPQPYKHNWNPKDKYSTIFTGWAYPPKDYKKWAELIYQWVKHCVNVMAKVKWHHGTGKFGMSRIFHIGKAHCRNIANCMIMQLMRLSVLCLRHVLAAQMLPVAVQKFLDTFIRHCLYDTNYATGKTGTPLNCFFSCKRFTQIDGMIQWL